MTRTGVFTISLDFELFWGVRDNRTVAEYGANLRGVHEAIPALLDLFQEFRIHATWAAVGLLFFRDHAELLANLPPERPLYADPTFCPYGYIEQAGSLEPVLHFAPDLIERIRAVPGQEIGTHTFSHFYCLEEGGTVAAFAADIAAAQAVAQARGLEISSIVLPRNQFAEEHLAVLARAGIRAYRGNEPHRLYHFTEQARNTRVKRILRIVDAYANLTGHHLFDPFAAPRPDGLVDVPASRFLRPWDSRLAWLEGLRLARIRASLDQAATTGRGFHLWWHPHNFGVNTARNIAFLRRVLEHFARLRERRGMRSLNMHEVAWLARQPARAGARLPASAVARSLPALGMSTAGVETTRFVSQKGKSG